VVHRGKPVNIDENWWRQRLQQALELRKPLAGTKTNGYRLLHGENDGFPGLVVDRYDDVAVAKIYTAAWLPHAPLVQRLLLEIPEINHLVLRLSRTVEAKAAAAGLVEGWWHGSRPIPIVFQENGILFEADVLKGQKTGFFLDQRENRQRVASLAFQLQWRLFPLRRPRRCRQRQRPRCKPTRPRKQRSAFCAQPAP
jgi:23S rRNA (cytosine1962-C5)-methyltransferase